MSILRSAALVLATCLALSAAEPPRLGDAGLAAGPAERVLPGAALVHVSLVSPARSLERLDVLLQPFVPARILPPDMRASLSQPRPVLALASRQFGMPLDAAMLGRFTGLDPARSIGLTLYAGDDGLDWVLSLPVADFAAVRGLLFSLSRPRAFQARAFGRLQGWQLEGANPDLPRSVSILSSSDVLYCCSSPALAARLAGQGQGVLADDPLWARQQPGADFSILVSTAMAKPFIADGVRMFSRLPPRMLAGMRRDLLRSLGPEGRRGFNLQVRMYLGLDSFDQLLDYAECLASAASEVVVPALGRSLLGIDGALLSVEMKGVGIGASCCVQAAGIDGLAAEAIPLGELREALAAIPGDRCAFQAEGRRKPAQPGSLVADWLDLANAKLKAKGGESLLMPALAAYYRAEERAPALGDAVPWVLDTAWTQAPQAPAKPGLAAWFASLGEALPTCPLQVFPAGQADTAAAQLEALAAVNSRNQARWTKALQESQGDQRWIDSQSRFRREDRPGKAARLVYEDAWLTRSGLFGYSQHELVNRCIYYSARQGRLQFLQQVAGDGPCWLDGPASAARPLPPGLAGLLDRVPAGAGSLACLRVLPLLPRFVELVEGLENAARHDLDACMDAAAAAVNAHQGDAKGLEAALVRIQLPLMVSSVNIDPQAGAIYLVLAGGLRYPRPALAPQLRALLAEPLAQAEQVGGLALWTRAEPGRWTIGVEDDLRGLALSLRGAVEAAYTAYFAGGDPEAALRASLGAQGDGEASRPDQILVFNPMWDAPRR